MPSTINIDLDTISKTAAGALATALLVISGGALDAVSSGSDTSTGTGANTAPSTSTGTATAPAGTSTTTSNTPITTTTPVTTASSASVSVADAIAAKYFPANIGLSAFPSPENSSILRLGALITGEPYLRGTDGAVHTMVPVDAKFTNGYAINSAPALGGGDDHDPIQELLVRQGQVHVKVGGGQWQIFNSGGGSLYNATLPDAFATDATTGATTSTVATSSVKAPALPAPMSPAPGASGKVLTVGVGKAFSTITAAITAAAAGDTVAVDAGIYKESPPAWTMPLMLQAIGGQAIIDATGLTGSLARGKGALVPCADSIIDGIRVTGVAMDQEGAQLTSGVRPDTGCGYLTLKNVELDGNQSGLGSGGDLTMQITVDGGHFHANGLAAGNSGNGYTHNIYTGAGTSLILKNGFTSTEPNGGHAVKHRGFALAVSGGGLFNATDAAVFDIPQGSVAPATIDGVIITKPAGANNHAIIDYGSENSDSGNGGLLITNSVINALCDNPFMLIGSGSIVTVDAATKAKTTGAITANGGKIVGL